ncbi:hypothetical protein LTR36_001229 [Oleoguttula mirabilis]|uniref:Uncharacterized protein n=1 Tax=Oleoguttula mirabilis TaxID=1507867 RepID=A0AAV9JNQ8_9PEZI|nr:hypothetical protein LTR36_001229 [Oleoguttula mirabilis]
MNTETLICCSDLQKTARTTHFDSHTSHEDMIQAFLSFGRSAPMDSNVRDGPRPGGCCTVKLTRNRHYDTRPPRDTSYQGRFEGYRDSRLPHGGMRFVDQTDLPGLRPCEVEGVWGFRELECVEHGTWYAVMVCTHGIEDGEGLKAEAGKREGLVGGDGVMQEAGVGTVGGAVVKRELGDGVLPKQETVREEAPGDMQVKEEPRHED